MFQNLLLKKMLKSQGIGDDQIDMVLGLIEKHPELFQKISGEIQEKTNAGVSQMDASMEVMKKYESELRGLKDGIG